MVYRCTLLKLPLTLHLLLHDLLPLVGRSDMGLSLDDLLDKPLELILATGRKVQIGINIG